MPLSRCWGSADGNLGFPSVEVTAPKPHPLHRYSGLAPPTVFCHCGVLGIFEGFLSAIREYALLLVWLLQLSTATLGFTTCWVCR